MDDLIQILVFLAIAFLSLAAGGKRKPQTGGTPAPRPRPQVPDRYPARTAPRQQTPPSRPVSTEAPHEIEWTPRPMPSEVGPEDLLDLLQGRVPEALEVEAPGEEATEQPEAVSLEPLSEDARSLETLEAAGEASHKRFRDKYPTAPEPAPVTERPAPRFRFGAATVRQAVVWREILGPPKGMQ